MDFIGGVQNNVSESGYFTRIISGASIFNVYTTALNYKGFSDGDTYLENYVVPTGKILKIMGLRFFYNTSTTAVNSLIIGYGDDVTNTSTPPTNAVTLSVTTFYSIQNVSNTLQQDASLNIPAGKYPFIRCSDTNTRASIILYCKLIDA